ncbi:MAG: glutathione S-transferase family protein [Xenophilus sp.]
MLELYHAWVSTCSQRVRMALHEKGLDWQDRCLSLRDGEHLGAAYLRLNPNGVVPTLVHDGQPIGDSTVIMEYLEDVFAQRPLRPAQPLARARMRMWQQYLDEVATPATRVPSFQQSFGHAARAMSPAERAANADRRPLRKHFYLRMGPEGFAPGEVEAALEQIAQTFARADAALAADTWLAGGDFTFADVSLLPTVVRMEDLDRLALLDARPHLRAWYGRMQVRPSFAAAYGKNSRKL